jgi:hypothetical protein
LALSFSIWRRRNNLHSAALCFALVALGAAGAPRAAIIDQVVAVVEGEVITLSDLQAAIQFGLVPIGKTDDPVAEALEPWIRRQLELGEVNRYAAPEPDEAVLARRVEMARARFGSPAELAAALAATGMSEAGLRNLIRDNLRIERYLDQRFTAAPRPTDDEVARYYREHQAEFVTAGGRASPEAAQDLARQRLAEERRQSLVADWLDRLRRRANVSILYEPAP